MFPTTDPTLLGLGWGILATWWVGLLLGLALAVAARAGRRPARLVESLVRPVAWLLAVTGAAALLMGIIGYVVADAGGVVLTEPLATMVPRDRHPRFLADLWAHCTSYLFGAAGGLVACANVWRSLRATA